MRLPALLLLAALACHHAKPPATANLQCITAPVLPPRDARASDSPLTAAQREALIAEARAYRAAWQAAGITHYRLTVAVGCFCPWPQQPRILEAQGGKVVALFDTAGRRDRTLREPWILYTIDGLFDVVEQTARRADALAVRYDACFGYPTSIRGDQVLRLPDDWFWVSATDLAPRP